MRRKIRVELTWRSGMCVVLATKGSFVEFTSRLLQHPHITDD